jgi:translocation and assembly module TamA
MVRVGVRRFCIILVCLAGAPAPAYADWFFGLFGGEEQPPAPGPQILPYRVEFDAGDSTLAEKLRDASDLYRLRTAAPENGDALARRVAADLPRLLDALWAEGYYNATLRAVVADQPIGLTGEGQDRAGAAADRMRGQSLVPIRIEAAPGPQFKLRAVSLIDARTRGPFSPGLLDLNDLRVHPGDPARAGIISGFGSQSVDVLRGKSYPLAKTVATEPVVRHNENIVDVAVTIDPGPKGGIGPVSIRGEETVDPAVLRSFVYLEDGESYSPQKLAALRKSLGNVEIVGSVRILEADKLDKNGNLPLDVVIGERKRHLVSLSAQYSTVDGPSGRVAWTDRNLFGGGERLRLESTVGYATNLNGKTVSSRLDSNRLIGRIGGSFIKPGLWGTRNDLLIDAFAVREITDYYISNFVNVTGAIRHRFNDSFSIQGGLEYERGRSTDILGKIDYTLVGIPLSLRYDDTDNLLDPTRGYSVVASGGVYPQALGSTIDLYQSKVQVSAYHAFDNDARYVIAGRLGFGSLGGSPLTSIPDNRRFFAGGGGSVRGFAYRSLSPLGPGNVPIGGRSLVEGSLEARIKVTETIGVVPFVDAGSAFTQSYPDFNSSLRYAAGLGLRYYTGFGPIRLDVAMPLNRRKGEAAAAIYIGIGQAF